MNNLLQIGDKNYTRYYVVYGDRSFICNLVAYSLMEKMIKVQDFVEFFNFVGQSKDIISKFGQKDEVQKI